MEQELIFDKDVDFISGKCDGSKLGIPRKYTVGSRFEPDSVVFSVIKSSTWLQVLP